MAQQVKKTKKVLHCPHHAQTALKRRRGRQTHKWLWYCPIPNCQYMFYEAERETTD